MFRCFINAILIVCVAVFTWIVLPDVLFCVSRAFEDGFDSFWLLVGLENAGCIMLFTIGALCLSSPFWGKISRRFRWFLGLLSVLAVAFVAFTLIESGAYKFGWRPSVVEPIATVLGWLAVSFPLLFYGQGWAVALRWLYVSLRVQEGPVHRSIPKPKLRKWGEFLFGIGLACFTISRAIVFFFFSDLGHQDREKIELAMSVQLMAIFVVAVPAWLAGYWQHRLRRQAAVAELSSHCDQSE